MTAPVMSPELRDYLSDYYLWATTGAPDGEPYRRCCGLCDNAPSSDIEWDLHRLLVEEFGDRYVYPFGGEREFNRRVFNDTQHENPERLAWLRRVLEIEAVS